jgi:hypothetical protein
MSFQAHGCWEARKGFAVEGIRDTRASSELVRPFFRFLHHAQRIAHGVRNVLDADVVSAV